MKVNKGAFDLILLIYEEKMAKNSVEESEKLDVINIPSIAFKSFIKIAQQNQISGNLLQTMCYLLGPAQKTTNEEILIDTVVLPKQTCTNIWVEDKGIEEKSTIEFLREHFITKKKEVFAWVHTRSPGQNDCEFSSIDIHTQYALEKYVSKKIVGIIIQI